MYTQMFYRQRCFKTDSLLLQESVTLAPNYGNRQTQLPRLILHSLSVFKNAGQTWKWE